MNKEQLAETIIIRELEDCGLIRVLLLRLAGKRFARWYLIRRIKRKAAIYKKYKGLREEITNL